MNPQYRIFVVEFMSGQIWGELPASDLSFTRPLSGAGSATVELPLSSPVPWQALQPWRVLIYIQRGQQVLWGGPLLGFSGDLEAETVTLSAVGLWAYYRRRQITATSTFVQQDQGTIARRLIEDFADGTGRIPWNTGPRCLSWDSSEVTGIRRDRTYYAHERKFVGQAVEDLTGVISGFSFRIDHGWLGSVLTSTIRFLPAAGEPTDVVLDHGSNCDVPAFTVDGTGMATEAAVTGAGDGEDQMAAWWYNLPLETDPSRRIPRLSAVESHQDVTAAATLTEYARQMIAAGSMPVTIPSVRLYAGGSPGPGDVQVGHQVRVRVRAAGRLLVDGLYVITEIAVKVSDSGEESVLALVPVGVFGDVGSAASP
ncbi:hypothetical protein [Kitasatospora sp. NPDC092286]|uniref:hypothetical protein n=1 Tax=Kitasatospora sp. NPDC092286 TaxID=3364087 RepID=UPI0037F62927